jgi:hypothetical protein
MVRRSYTNMIMQTSNQVVPLLRESHAISPLLYDYLTCITPHKHEKKIHTLLPFMDDKDLDIQIDQVGNIIVKVGAFRKDFRTVFSCHMDTMHHEGDVDKTMHLCMTSKAGLEIYDKDFKEGLVYARYKWTNKDGQDNWAPMILGADDKIGMYIMTRMIEKRVPGMYMFHVGEEKGGIGSRHIRENTPRIFKGMRRAIAFDRMHYGDVINVQSSRSCCSKEFTNALAAALNEHMPPFQKFTGCTGMWTDTANYTYIIAECSNISVGYFDQHLSSEHFDLVWLNDILLPAILKVDWEELPTVRDKVKAKEVDEKPAVYHGYNGHYHNNSDQEVKVTEITKDTPLWKVPNWTPTQGIPDGVSPIGMHRLAEKWLMYNGTKHQSIDVLLGLVKEVASLKGKLEALKNANDKAAPFRSSASFNDPGVKRNRLGTKCVLLGKATSLWWREITKETIQPLDDSDAKRIDSINDIAASIATQIQTIQRDIVNVTPLFEYQFNRNIFDFTMGATKYQYSNATLRNSIEEIMQYIARNANEPVFIDYKQSFTPRPNTPLLTGGDMNKGG